jgi:UDP-glucose 4-epimerase
MLITGYNGFIGNALLRKIGGETVDVKNLPDRIHARYFLHFASPSSNVLFSDDISCVEESIVDFIEVCKYCRKKRIKLIFPSSANIYLNNNPYSQTKTAMENIARAYLPSNHLALRIFAGYGVGEDHKKDYASVVYQWVKGMIRWESPVIYGDGRQSRDFVYIDDIVDNIVDNLDTIGFMDIGTGRSVSFNQVVKLINKLLGRNIKPVYVDKPNNYVEETICQSSIKNPILLEEGIKRIICHLI